MSPQVLLTTAGLLGAYVLFGGAYGAFYALGHIRGWSSCTRVSQALFALHVAVMLAVLAFTPLGIGWKILILTSTAVYAVIPSFTLRYLRGLHAP